MPLDDRLNQVMLTHAAIIYRGFARPPGGVAGLRAAMTALLTRLSPVQDQWDIVWGPATFHGDADPFADAAMYVAHRRKPSGASSPEQYVIVIRGTNPISLFDWMFGDFIVRRQVPWEYGPDAARSSAKISLSTALGLRILQSMHSNPHSAASTAPLPASAPAAAPADGASGPSLLRSFGDGIKQTLSGLELQALDGIESVTGDRFNAWATDLVRPAQSKEFARRLEALDVVVRDSAGGRIDPLRLVPDAASALRSFPGGVTLQEYLRDMVAQARGEVEVFVTGHSKGGALCTALASWLADTQGEPPGTPNEWDPGRKATLRAYSFAGPTPGNGAFANHVDKVLGNGGHRIFNDLDLVPHGFAARDIAAIPGLYNPPSIERAALELVASQLASAVQPLDYQHTHSDNVQLSGRLRAGLPLFAQAIHQHLDGYFEQLGLSGEMSARTFFGKL